MIEGRIAAFGVHAFTALGAVLGFQALIEVVAHRWEAAFAWLGAALLVDGLDGPLARRFAVSSKLPRFSGERLDLIIDYITYVLVPAYIIYEAQLVPDGLAWFAAALILLTSLFHFIDHESKTDDGFFVGFPALWNIVALYFLIFMPHPAINFIILLSLAALTFFPLKWIHPVRVEQLRPLTFCMMAVWSLAAIAALFQGFPASIMVQAILAITAIYFIFIGLSRSFNALGQRGKR